jgi:FKBP-type peptidyl-prolyl cis-trans isomerase SlyD
MQISRHKVATIDYTLTDDSGEVIDSSAGSPGLAYLHGEQNIIPGLENALEGKIAGDSLKVTVAPEEGYGVRDDTKVVTVPHDMFENASEVQVGARFYAQSPEGQQIAITVVEVREEDIVVDGNHPLAGQNLHFDVTVTDVRDASEEEISHGHVHGPGGHDHG